ncbi:MAG: stage III sporulation protein AG [Lachnospiraceae bacterium]|uniref:stage III sporulation protein AG n=1 Tax=Parablautia sp. Marseille-Q6255 TaxID=3039593 RepID=UPI0024BC9C2C|nr:stage III sporulation protein AG [Parablautia sp. Marseille-Q6255]
MKQWIEKLKQMKKDQIMILLLAGCLLLVISVPTDPASVPDEQEGKETEAPVYLSSGSQTQELEKKLQTILSHVEGIGKAEVMLTLKSNGRKIVEKDREESEAQQQSENSSSQEHDRTEHTVLQKDSTGKESPYVAEELKPEVSGVLVIAQGGDNPQTVSEITEAVMALFGVEAHKIKVMKME